LLDYIPEIAILKIVSSFGLLPAPPEIVKLGDRPERKGVGGRSLAIALGLKLKLSEEVLCININRQ
jgi:hypothetical protein